MYVEKIVRYLKPGGELAIVCPGYKHELRSDAIPDYLRDSYFTRQWHSFHSPAWWRHHWEKSGAVRVVCAEEVPEASEIWKASTQPDNPDAPVILADAGRLLTFSRVVARKLPGR